MIVSDKYQENTEEHVKSTFSNVAIIPQLHGETFPSKPVVISADKPDPALDLGKGKWQFLVALPFVGNPGTALKNANNSWRSSYTEPYAQNGHIVWQFPKYIEPELPREYTEKRLFRLGFLPEYFETLFPETWWSRGSGRSNSSHLLAYAETFCINDLVLGFALDTVRCGKESFSLLVIGENALGNALGTLWALRKYLYNDPSFKRIRLRMVDALEGSFENAEKLIEEVREQWPIEIDFECEVRQPSLQDLLPVAEGEAQADFVVVSRWIEDIQSNGWGMARCYRELFGRVAKIMGRNSLFLYVETDEVHDIDGMEQAVASLGPEHVSLFPNQDGTGWWNDVNTSFLGSGLSIPQEEGDKTAFSILGPQKARQKLSDEKGSTQQP